MNGNGAYPDEMAFRRNPAADPELAKFATALRAELVRPPAEAVRAALPAQLAEQARIAAAQHHGAAAAAAAAHSRRWLAAKIGLGVAAVPLVTAGLAVAGVHLPASAQSAFEGVGIELPNQGGAASGTDPVVPGRSGDGAAQPAPAGPARRSPRAGPRDSGGKRQTNGSQGRGKSGSATSRGKSEAAPGHNKPDKGPAQGKAVGKTGSTPPGQANKPAKPPKPPSPNKGQGQGKQ